MPADPRIEQLAARLRGVGYRRAEQALADWNALLDRPDCDPRSVQQRYAAAKTVLSHYAMLMKLLPQERAGASAPGVIDAAKLQMMLDELGPDDE